MRLLICLAVLSISLPYTLFAKAPLRSMPAGADFCLTNLADYNQYKTQLPAFLQTTPVWLGADKKMYIVYRVIAALKISFRGNTMVLNSDIWNPKDEARYTDTTEIKRACFFKNKKKMVIESVNGVFTESGYSNNSLTVQGVALAPVAAGYHQTLIDRVKTQNSGRPGRPTPAVGVGR